MSSKPLGRSPTCWVLLITCLCAQRSEGASNPPPPWLNRKDVIKTMPLPYQKLILQETRTVIKCAPIPLMNHRINTCRGPTRYGNECNFSCVKGYTLVGQQKLTCTLDGVYNFQAPTCNIKTCKTPQLPHGGHNWTCSNSYNYDSTCTINCAEGFRNERTFDRAPWEQANIRCKENGNWTRLPICKDVAAPVISNCPGYTQAYAARGTRSAVVQWHDIRATDVNTAEVTATQTEGQKSGSSFTEGAHKVSYKAVDASGLSDTCTFYINVQILHCPVPVMNASKVGVECQNQFSFGSACTLSCLQGYTLKGAQRISCEKHGETDMYWEYHGGEPKCAAVASKVLNFLCRDVGPDSATCTWFPPAHVRGQLLGYQIDYQEVSKSDTHTVVITNERTVSFTLANLKPDTDYVISIYAMNHMGRGVKTPLNIRTKPPVTTTTTTTTPQPKTVDPNACPAGSVSFNGQKTPVACTPCRIGFYLSEAGQVHCKVCPAGFTTWYAGARSESDCVDETWTTPSTTTTTTTTPTPGSPCPAGFTSSTGTAPGCKKCPDNQEPNAAKTSCQWCNYIPDFGFKCSAQ